MGFLSTIVSTFFANYLLIMIVRYLPIKRKQFWMALLISLGNFSEIGIFIYSYVGIGFDLTMLPYMLAEIVGILIAYIAAMMMVFDGIKIFKSKRYREFERALKLTKTKTMSSKVAGGIILGLAVLMISLSIYLAQSLDDKKNLINMIVLIIFAIIFVLFGLKLMLPSNSEERGKKEAIVFIIQQDRATLVYTKETQKNQTYKDLLGKANDYYICDDYGYIVTKTQVFHAYGIKVQNVPNDILGDIKMDLVDTEMYEPAINLLSKYNRQKIYLSEDLQVEKVQSIKK